MFSVLVKSAIRPSRWVRRSPSTTRFISAFSTGPQLLTHDKSFRLLSSQCVAKARQPLSPRIISLSSRTYQSLVPEPAKTSSLPQAPRSDRENPTQSEQRKKDWRIIRRLLENVWPKNDWDTRGRVLFGLSLLVGGKVNARWTLETHTDII